jgi:hypothetical protein
MATSFFGGVNVRASMISRATQQNKSSSRARTFLLLPSSGRRGAQLGRPAAARVFVSVRVVAPARGTEGADSFGKAMAATDPTGKTMIRPKRQRTIREDRGSDGSSCGGDEGVGDGGGSRREGTYSEFNQTRGDDVDDGRSEKRRGPLLGAGTSKEGVAGTRERGCAAVGRGRVGGGAVASCWGRTTKGSG